MTRTVVACTGFLPLLFLVELNGSLWLLLASLSLLLFSAFSLVQHWACKSGNPNFSKRSAFIRSSRTVCSLIAIFFVTMSYATWRAGLAMEQRLPSACHGSVVTAHATITSQVRTQHARHSRLKQVSRDKFDITIDTVVEASATQGCSLEQLPDRVTVSRYQNHVSPQSQASSFDGAGITWSELHYGDRITVVLQLREIRGLSAPDAFDQEKYALAQRISAFGTVKDLQPYSGDLDKRGGLISLSLLGSHIRSKAIERFDEHFASFDNAGVFAAVMFGEKVKLTPRQKDLFSKTGTSHLMAVSGLHIGLCMLLAKTVAQVLRFICTPHMLRILEMLMALSAGLAYLTVADWPVSGQRAYLMLSAWLLCSLFMRNSNRYALFLSAALIILIIDPLAIFDGGFWLSFFAVYILISLGAGLLRSQINAASERTVVRALIGRIVEYLAILFTLQIALSISLPFLLGALGMPFYPITFIANLVSVPIYSLLVIPVILIALVGLGFSLVFDSFPAISVWFIQVTQSILELADRCISVSNSVLHTLQILGNEYSFELSYSVWFAPIIMLLLTALLAGKSYPGYSAVLTLFSVLVSYGINHTASTITLDQSDLLVSQIDVGQGSAYLIQTRDQNWLYDAGPSFLFGGDAATSSIVPTLRYSGITRLSGLIISHGDDDHAGGLPSLLKSVHVEQLFTPVGQINLIPLTAKENGQSVRRIAIKKSSSQHIQPTLKDCLALNDTVTLSRPFAMRALWPQPTKNLNLSADAHPKVLQGKRADTQSPRRDKVLRSANNSSCVVQIFQENARDRSLLLLTGDIDASVEKLLVEKHREALESEILTVAHHGSLSSSTHTFLDAAAPRFALISAGYANRYRHPHPEVNRRLDLRGIESVSSASHGTVQWLYKSSEQKWVGPFCSRAEKSHFWQLNNNAEGCLGGLL